MAPELPDLLSHVSMTCDSSEEREGGGYYSSTQLQVGCLCISVVGLGGIKVGKNDTFIIRKLTTFVPRTYRVPTGYCTRVPSLR